MTRQSTPAREAVLEAVAYAARTLLRSADWTTCADAVLARLGPAVAADRAYIFTVTGDPAGEVHARQRHEWVAPGITPQIDNPDLQDFALAANGLTHFRDSLAQRGMLHGAVAGFPAAERAVLEPQHIRSILVVPIFVEGVWWGFIGFDDCRTDAPWPDPTREGLRMVADSLGAAVARAANEAALAAGEARLRALMEAVADGLIVVDEAGRITSRNHRAAVQFAARGNADGAPVDTPLAALFSAASRDRVADAMDAACRRAGRDVPVAVEAQALRADGTLFPAEVSLGAWLEHGAPRLTAVVRDLTERREAERQIWNRQQAESLGNLASGMAHDFNNLLQPILSLTAMTRDRLPPDSRDRQRLHKVVEAATQARDLVGRILAFSRGEAPDRRPVDLAAVVREAIPLLRGTVPSSVTIRETALAPVTVMADPSRLQAVLMNLAGNTADALAGRPGTLTIGVTPVTADETLRRRLPALDKDRAYACLCVGDDGPGIDPDALGRVFDPFFTTKPVGEGTGLGLAMVLDVVRKHEGTITARSQPDRGTTFEIYLPVANDSDEGY